MTESLTTLEMLTYKYHNLIKLIIFLSKVNTLRSMFALTSCPCTKWNWGNSNQSNDHEPYLARNTYTHFRMHRSKLFGIVHASLSTFRVDRTKLLIRKNIYTCTIVLFVETYFEYVKRKSAGNDRAFIRPPRKTDTC